MTVSTSTAKAGPYAGSGSAGPFTVPFRFLDADHLRVVRTSGSGFETDLAITTDYTVLGVGLASGSVTLTAPLQVGERLTILRDVPFTQEADYVNNDAFPAESHEAALDKLTMQTQQLNERLDRTLLLPAGVSTLVSTDLPFPESDKLLKWNASATALENANLSALATVVAYGTATADVFTADGVQTVYTLSNDAAVTASLDISIGGVAQVPGNDYELTAPRTVTFTTAPPNGTVVSIRYSQGLPEVVVEGGGGGLCVADITALKLQQGGAYKTVRTRYYNLAKPLSEGGGVYVCDTTDTTTPDNGGTVIVSNDGSRWKLQVEGPFLPARQCGVSGDGVTGETARVVAAIAQARVLKKGLLIEGTPLLNSQLVIDAPIEIRFAGHPNIVSDIGGVNGAVVPASWFKVITQTLSQSAVIVGHPGIRFYGGGIGSDPAGTWAFDGLTILANNFRWEGGGSVFNMGRDGIRLGTDLGIGNFNSNSVVLENPHCCWNGRHGINIGDDDGSEDANTFLITKPTCLYNGGHGIRLGKTYLGGTIIAPLCENNAVGMYFEPEARQIVVIGGDLEANTAPNGLGPMQNIIQAGNSSFTNLLLGLIVQGVPRLTPIVFSGTWTPLVTGATSGGTVNYTRQSGVYSLVGGVLNAVVDLQWSSHTGTGQTYISLPSVIANTIASSFPGVGAFMPVNVTITNTFSSPAISSPLVLRGLVPTDTFPLRIQLYVENAGALAALGISANGGLTASVSIPILGGFGP